LRSFVRRKGEHDDGGCIVAALAPGAREQLAGGVDRRPGSDFVSIEQPSARIRAGARRSVAMRQRASSGARGDDNLREHLTEIVDGPLFRRVDRHGNLLGRVAPAVVNRVVKSSANAAGLDSSMFGAHSLRSGWITTAAPAKRSESEAMRHMRHLSIAAYRGNVGEATKWMDHPGLGLL